MYKRQLGAPLKKICPKSRALRVTWVMRNRLTVLPRRNMESLSLIHISTSERERVEVQRFDVLAVLYELHEAQLVVFIHEVDANVA